MGLNVEFVVAETNEEAIEALKNISPDTLNESQYTNDKGEVVTTEMAFKENKLEGLIVPNSNKIIISLESSVENIKVDKLSNTQYRVFTGPFNSISSLQKAFNDISILEFENIEIIRND